MENEAGDNASTDSIACPARKRVANSGPHTAEDGERGRSPKAIRFGKTGFGEQAEFGLERRV